MMIAVCLSILEIGEGNEFEDFLALFDVLRCSRKCQEDLWRRTLYVVLLMNVSLLSDGKCLIFGSSSAGPASSKYPRSVGRLNPTL